MKLLIRSIRNVLRSPLRLVLVVALLGTSLMFVAAMTSLSTSVLKVNYLGPPMATISAGF